MPFRSIGFLLYFLGSSTAALIYPMVGIVCYIVLYHVYPQTTWWGQRLNFMGIRYSFIVGVCLILGTAFNLNKLRFGKKLLQPVEWMMLLTFLAMILSGMTGITWDNKTWFMLDKMSKVFLFALVLSHVVVTRRRLWIICLLLVGMAWYVGHEAHIAPRGSFEQGRLNGIGGPDFRESAGLAIHLVAILPFVAVAFLQKSLWIKVCSFLAGCYAVNAILLCRARSAFVAAMVAGVFAMCCSPKRYRRWIVLILILGMIGGMVLSDEWFWDRMVTIFTSAEERDDSAQLRLIIWSAAWEMIKDRPLGVGVGQFERQIKLFDPDLIQRRRDAHNTFILCLAETGWLGLTTFLLTLSAAWLSLRKTQRIVRQKLSDPDLYLLLIFATRLSLIVYLVSGMFVSRLYTEGFWWFVILSACLSRCVENEVRDQVVQETMLYQELKKWSGKGQLPQWAT